MKVGSEVSELRIHVKKAETLIEVLKLEEEAVEMYKQRKHYSKDEVVQLEDLLVDIALKKESLLSRCRLF